MEDYYTKNVLGKLVFRCTKFILNMLCSEQMRFTYTSTMCQNESEERMDVREIRLNNENVIKSYVIHEEVPFVEYRDASQINEPTICYSFSSLLLEVYVQLNVYRASSRS
jgi:hypothetical protein